MIFFYIKNTKIHDNLFIYYLVNILLIKNTNNINLISKTKY